MKVNKIFLLAILIAWSAALYRDFTVGALFPLDLRNRVVGARLIHDGVSPYFYKWKPGNDSIRYYDAENFDSFRVSVMTASPFFHHVIGPVAEMQQANIQIWWVGIQHALLLVMVALALLAAGNQQAKYVILSFAALFLYTDGWKMSIQNGQNYVFIPFLAMCLYYLMVKMSRSGLQAFFAGICTIVLLLIRPNTLVFFLPGIFLLKNYDRKWWMIFAIPVLLLGGWTVLDKHERSLWLDYKESLGQQLKIHQDLHPDVQDNAPDPKYENWEGIDRAKLEAYGVEKPMHVRPENGNVFYLVRLATNHRISPDILLLVCGCLLLGLLCTYGLKKPYDPATTLLFGYCLYMILDFFSPIFRSQYYTVQLLFPILAAPAIPRFSGKWVQAAMLAGIVLNITHIPFLPVQHTIGEYLIIGIITLFSLPQLSKRYQ